MLKRFALLAAVAAAFAFVVYAAADKPDGEPKQLPVPDIKFNEVKEVAPGVFLPLFRNLRERQVDSVRRQ